MAGVARVQSYLIVRINKELAYIRRAFRLGAPETPPLVVHVPRFEMLDQERQAAPSANLRRHGDRDGDFEGPSWLSRT